MRREKAACGEGAVGRFHILCSDGSRTGVCSGRTLPWMVLGTILVLLGNVRPYQTPVREQPDTGYWKILPSYFPQLYVLAAAGLCA